MNSTIGVVDAVSMIQRLADELGTGKQKIAIRIEDNGNVWVGERLAMTIREVTA
jgi:hypothetical protein